MVLNPPIQSSISIRYFPSGLFSTNGSPQPFVHKSADANRHSGSLNTQIYGLHPDTVLPFLVGAGVIGDVAASYSNAAPVRDE